MTYPQDHVIETIRRYAVPVQFDNSKSENNQLLYRLHHIWTPDVRILSRDGYEMYRWDGFLPPDEYIARFECGIAMAYLRSKRFDEAERIYMDVLTRFSTTYAAPEAQYYLGVVRYQRDPDSDELGTQWENLRSRYPASEYRVKQSFKELPTKI